MFCFNSCLCFFPAYVAALINFKPVPVYQSLCIESVCLPLSICIFVCVSSVFTTWGPCALSVCTQLRFRIFVYPQFLDLPPPVYSVFGACQFLFGFSFTLLKFTFVFYSMPAMSLAFFAKTWRTSWGHVRVCIRRGRGDWRLANCTSIWNDMIEDSSSCHWNVFTAAGCPRRLIK